MVSIAVRVTFMHIVNVREKGGGWLGQDRKGGKKQLTHHLLNSSL